LSSLDSQSFERKGVEIEMGIKWGKLKKNFKKYILTSVEEA